MKKLSPVMLDTLQRIVESGVASRVSSSIWLFREYPGEGWNPIEPFAGTVTMQSLMSRDLIAITRTTTRYRIEFPCEVRPTEAGIALVKGGRL